MTHTADSPSPTKRIARERLGRKREKVRAGAAAMRRETFHAGMWAVRAPRWMWPALLIITGIGAALRLLRLGFPHRLIFDETYYVKDGYSVVIFGADDSSGWRFSVAIIGSLTIFLIGVIAWKLFRSGFFACVAAGLLSVDGEHFVHSRTSLLDIVLMAFVLLAFYFVLLDREQ